MANIETRDIAQEFEDGFLELEVALNKGRAVLTQLVDEFLPGNICISKEDLNNLGEIALDYNTIAKDAMDRLEKKVFEYMKQK